MVDIQSKTSIDGQLLSSIDSEARKARLGSLPTYGPSSTLFTIILMADFNLTFMCFVIVYVFLATHAFILSTFHSKTYLGFIIVWREDPRLL